MSTKKSPAHARTEIRIGIADTTQELSLESESTQEEIIKLVTSALDSGAALTLVDIKGRNTIVPNGKISFVEVGESAERKVGFTNL
ncbi:MAG: DUF3107 domain-containing protein [Actinomycetes bacterium]